ncbi:MAG: OmpA family protein [Actinobacteria bacterium]|nr:OmpA family protein [Actinomycetota bacterium]
MSPVLLFALLVSVPLGIGPQTLEPTTSELASSVTVFDPSKSVTVYDIEKSVSPLQTETKSGEQTVVTISSDVLFDFGSAVLTSDATAKVKALAPRIDGARPVAVVGHTDSVGGDTYNDNLSNQRAQAAEMVLRASLPTGTQITSEGRGAREPVAPNSSGGKDDPVGRAKNRRVTISFTPRAP